jgi:predicted DNA-binding WGR domain protein
MVMLIQVNPAQRRNRWYSITVQPSLLDGAVVVCRWGSRRTAFQQTRLIPMPNQVAAEVRAAELVMQRIRRGYVVVAVKKASQP